MKADDPDILSFGKEPRRARVWLRGRRARFAVLSLAGVTGLAVAGLVLSSPGNAAPHHPPAAPPAAIWGQATAVSGFLRAELPADRAVTIGTAAGSAVNLGHHCHG